MGLDELSVLLEGVEDSGTGTEGKPLIMVVDDDRAVLESLERLLARQYRVLTCSSTVQSLAALNEEVSAVVLDVKMRDHDGFWASEEIRKKNAHVPIIFYSAYQDLKKPLDIINQYQPFGYVAKGKDPKLLLSHAGEGDRLLQGHCGEQEGGRGSAATPRQAAEAEGLFHLTPRAPASEAFHLA